ncbi:hypothetical protein BM477_02635 [Boudabousia marimammalium]|uniref:Sensor-like histidine kinase SenX3 n=1 Tax=Boudabousia marimammalium TaxID=156892 RepID=A0A1Q5PS88_9ACTO|nr:hypothetical protein BM477_02635 [Boudabousia marimammalium]
MSKRGRRVIIETRNHADGLEERSYSEIFDRFTRLDEHRNAATGGNGIGLAILQSIVEKYRGKAAASSDGEQLSIKVELPA